MSLVPTGCGVRVCREQAEETPLVDQQRAEMVERCPLTTRHLVKRCMTSYKSQKSRDVRRATVDRGDWPVQPSDLDGRAGSRRTTAMTTCETSAWKPVGLEALGNKASHNVSGARWGSGISASHWTVQAGSGFRREHSQGRDPRTHELKEHSQLQAQEHTQPQGDRERQSKRRVRDEKGSEETASKRAQCVRCQDHHVRQDRGDGEHSKTQMRRNAKLPSSRNRLCGYADERRLSLPR